MKKHLTQKSKYPKKLLLLSGVLLAILPSLAALAQKHILLSVGGTFGGVPNTVLFMGVVAAVLVGTYVYITSEPDSAAGMSIGAALLAFIFTFSSAFLATYIAFLIY